MSKGFSLIEVVVASGILLIVLQLVVGAYARFVHVERAGINEQEMQEDIRLVLQLFNREARTAYGTTYQAIVSPVTHQPNGIVFRNQEGICVKYEHLAAPSFSLQRSDSAGLSDLFVNRGHNCADPVIYNGPQRLTDDTATEIVSLQFDARAAIAQAPPSFFLAGQGFVTVRLQVRSSAINNPVLLQSTVTSRQFISYPPP